MAGAVIVWVIGEASLRARQSAIAAISGAVGRPVEIGQVSGDPWRGVIFETVSLPAGSARPTLTARRITVTFDPWMLIGDVLYGRGFVRSILQILVDEPALRVDRNPAGAWNLASLFPGGAGRTGATGFPRRLVVLNGTITFADRNRLAPRVFAARFSDVNGSAEFAGRPKVALRASFVEDRAGRRVPGRLQGVYLTEQGLLDLDVQASGGDAVAWGQYLLNPGQFRITGGQFDAALHIIRTAAGGQIAVDYSGRIVLRGGRAFVPVRRATVAGVQGTLEISDRSVRSERVRATLNGSPLVARGEATFYGEPRLDLAVQSPAANLTTVAQVFFPRFAARMSGVAKGEARITGPLSALRLDGKIDAARGQLDDQGFEQTSARFSFDGQSLSLADLRSATGGGRVAGNVWWSLEEPAYFLSLDVQGADADAVRRWAPTTLPAFEGRVTGTLTALRRGPDLMAAGRAEVANAEVRGVALDQVDAFFRTGPSGTSVETLRVRQGPSWAFARGSVDPEGSLALQTHGGTTDVGSLPIPRAGRELTGRADFSGSLRGTVDAPQLVGSVLGRGVRFGDIALQTVQGGIGLSPGTLRLANLRARSGQMRLVADGTVQWDPGGQVGLDVQVERGAAETVSQMFSLPLPVSGLLDGRIRLDGPTARPSVSGSVSLRQAAVFGYSVGQATAGFRWDGTRLTIEGGSLQRGSSAVRVAGTYDRRRGLNLDVSSRAFSLRDAALPPLGVSQIDGRLDLTGRITGQPSAPSLSMQAASSDLVINGRRFDEASGAIQWEARTLRLAPLALRLGKERYEFNGDVTLAGIPQVSLSASVTNGRLSTLFTLANTRLDLPLDGTVSGTASLEGTLANPAARLDLRLNEGSFGTHRLVGGRFNLTLRNRSVTIEDFELRPTQGRIAATGRIDLEGENQVEISGSDVDLDFLRPAFRLKRPLVGSLNFTTQLGGTLASPEIGFSLDITKGGVEGATFDSLVANAFYRDGLLQLQNALLVQGGHKLRASGSVPFNPALRRFEERGPLDFRLTLAQVDLSLLRLATDRVEEAAGAVQGELRVSGSMATPLLSGALQSGDGRIKIRGLEEPIDALRLDLRVDENIIKIAEATARVGGGTARLDGSMRLVQAAGPRFELVVPPDAPLVLQGTNMRIIYPPVLDARVDGTARFWGTVGDPRRPPTMDGRVTVSQGIVAIVPGNESGPIAFPLTFAGMRFDAGQDLSVRVGGLQFGINPGGSLLLTGTLKDPALEGMVEAQRGVVQALGNVFEVMEATARFQQPLGLRPVVFVRARTDVGSTRIFLTERGIAPDQLQPPELRSDPDRPREEILALLGQQAGITQALAGDVTGVLRRQLSRLLLAPATSAIGRALGLSELSIDYDFQQPIQLRIGKRLFSNLYLTLTTSFGPQQLWAWALEYRFAPDWMLSLGTTTRGVQQAVLWYTTRF